MTRTRGERSQTEKKQNKRKQKNTRACLNDAKVPKGGDFLYTIVLLATVACGASSWNTQNSQKRLVFSENSEGDNS